MEGGLKMGRDLTFFTKDGVLNLRVGAIILKERRVLMVGNERADYLYSVGGRIRFGETAEEAVRREVYEETGVRMEIDRLGFVHENFFVGDAGKVAGRKVHEISFFYYMKTPEDFSPVCGSFTDDHSKERLVWVDLEENWKYYPAFFKEELPRPVKDVKQIVTIEI